MKATWLNDNESNELIVFYNGWGQDAGAVAHLKTDKRVLMLNDYRTLDAEMPDLSKYARTYVVAWSMGVWAAANTMERMGIVAEESTALCGTELPVSDGYGIPTKIMKVTIRGLKAKGCGGFTSRMFATADDRALYPTTLTHRSDDEQTEELERIDERSASEQQTAAWTRVGIADQDMIFAPANLRDYWGMRQATVCELHTGHCPFHLFDTWEKLIELCPTNDR